MHSFAQSLSVFFCAFIVLSYFVSPALGAPTGHRSALGFAKRHLPAAAAFHAVPYGKASDAFLRINDSYMNQNYQNLVMPDDASSGRSYNSYHPSSHRPSQPYPNHHRHQQKHDAHVPHSTSLLTRPFLQPFATWLAKVKAFSFTAYLAALEQMQGRVASH